MEVLKLVGIAIIVCIAAIICKQVRPEFSLYILVIGGVILLYYTLSSFTSIFVVLNKMITKTGIDSELFKIVFKIIGVGYLIEFGVGVCNDTGNNSIGDKLILGGKVMILLMSLPIISSLFEIVVGILQWN